MMLDEVEKENNELKARNQAMQEELDGLKVPMR